MDFLGKAVDAVINPVLENIAYPFKASNNVKALDLATRQLEATQADVKNRVEDSELQGLSRTNRVEEWLGRVEVVKEEANKIRKRKRDEERSWSLNCWSNYCISKEAAKKLAEVQDLCENGARFEEVAIRLPPRVQEFPIASAMVPKEEAALQEIIRYIDNDDDDIIGIWGMGGVGKTRLLHLVNNWYKRSSAFEVVCFVTASQECSVEKIQDELCKKYDFGRANTVQSQAMIISNYLRNRNFLLLLDDIWDPIDLQRVGIPFPLGTVGQFKREVVITTRKLTICTLMNVKKAHRVDCLDSDDALRLFLEKVGDETINSDPLIRSLAEQVVKELDGLPLALITIGSAMQGKIDSWEWEDAIDKLRNSCQNEIEITRDEEKVYHRLKFSYDNLENNELRDCFLACSLWPEDYEIKKNELIESWMGLGILHTSHARSIYYPGYTVIRKLVSACLLETTKDGDCVKMHDVIRDMALWLACDLGKNRDKWIVRTGVGVDEVLHIKDRWCQTERAALMKPNKPTAPIPCQANKLYFLKVFANYNNSFGPLFNNLNSFCALTFLDLSRCRMEFVPPAVSNLVNLRYLNLSYNYIRSVPEELKLLINLEYLILSWNKIGSFPKGIISELRKLRMLDLFLLDFSTKLESRHMTWLIKELECLDSIRSLSISLGCAAHFQSLMELPSLPIRSLSLYSSDEDDLLLIPSSFIGNNKIQDNLTRLWLHGRSVKKIVIESEESRSHLKNLECLHIEQMFMLKEIIWTKVIPKDLFVKLRKLDISWCNLKDVSWTLYLPCLKKLHIGFCNEMTQLIHYSSLAGGTEEIEEIVTPTFPSLQELEFYRLLKLQIICDQSITFPSLERIKIHECPKLKKLPFQSNPVPSKLRSIEAEKTWWEQLEWEDDNFKKELQHLCKLR